MRKQLFLPTCLLSVLTSELAWGQLAKPIGYQQTSQRLMATTGELPCWMRDNQYSKDRIFRTDQ